MVAKTYRAEVTLNDSVSSCPALDHFKFIYLCSGVRVPDSTAIFQDWSNKGEISKSFYLD